MIAALPIPDLSQPTVPLTLPFYGDGGGWQSEIQLVNTTDSNLKGTVQFFPSLSGTEVIYDIPARSAVAIPTPGTGSQTKTGWVQVTPNPGTVSPAGWLILSNKLNGVTRSMATIASTPAFSTYRIAKTSGATEVNVRRRQFHANPSTVSATVNRMLTDELATTGRHGA
jgi:hypothetical protein